MALVWTALSDFFVMKKIPNRHTVLSILHTSFAAGAKKRAAACATALG